MQRVESCHFFSCQSMHMSKKRMCKEECKKRTITAPCSVKKCAVYIYVCFLYMRVHVCVCGILYWNQFFSCSSHICM